MVNLPKELVTDNGKKLEEIGFKLAHLNGFEENFIACKKMCIHFGNRQLNLECWESRRVAITKVTDALG